MAPMLVGDARRREAYLITIKLSHTHTSASRLPSACKGGSVPGFSSANHNSCEDILGGKNCSSTSQQDIPRGQRLGETIEHIDNVLPTCTTLVFYDTENVRTQPKRTSVHRLLAKKSSCIVILGDEERLRGSAQWSTFIWPISDFFTGISERSIRAQASPL